MARGDDKPDAPIDEAPGIVAAPERILAWLTIAKPRDEFVYATRCYLPLGSAGAATMRDLCARGLVVLYQRRVDPAGSRQFTAHNYVARRTSAPLRELHTTPIAAKAPTERRRRGNADTDAMNAVLPMLQRAARFARPCPTDAHMAARLGRTREDVSAAIQALRIANVIRVQPAPAPTLRQIVIVETGHRTGMVTSGGKAT